VERRPRAAPHAPSAPAVALRGRGGRRGCGRGLLAARAERTCAADIVLLALPLRRVHRPPRARPSRRRPRVARALAPRGGRRRRGARGGAAPYAGPRLRRPDVERRRVRAAIAFTFEDFFLGLYESPRAVALALLATGALLWATRYAKVRPGLIGWRQALVVGALQGAAIVPGISRSGATIGAATLLGVERETAVRYSFLLSIPAIAGAALFQADGAALADAAANAGAYAAGVVAAMVVGYGALFLLVLLVRRSLFHSFALYCWALGAAVLVAAA
jgi:hypothetical protein